MPIDSNLSPTINAYLEIIERLTSWHNGFDSMSPEHKMFEKEVEYYLNLIREEINQHKGNA